VFEVDDDIGTPDADLKLTKDESGFLEDTLPSVLNFRRDKAKRCS
jgi:hypothetical protein